MNLIPAGNFLVEVQEGERVKSEASKWSCLGFGPIVDIAAVEAGDDDFLFNAAADVFLRDDSKSFKTRTMEVGSSEEPESSHDPK